jgi:hypothetical protein
MAAEDKDERDLRECMERLRDIRQWAHNSGVNPWIIRQALVMTLEMDTMAAREVVKDEHLAKFDEGCKEETRALLTKGRAILKADRVQSETKGGE